MGKASQVRIFFQSRMNSVGCMKGWDSGLAVAFGRMFGSSGIMLQLVAQTSGLKTMHLPNRRRLLSIDRAGSGWE